MFCCILKLVRIPFSTMNSTMNSMMNSNTNIFIQSLHAAKWYFMHNPIIIITQLSIITSIFHTIVSIFQFFWVRKKSF